MEELKNLDIDTIVDIDGRQGKVVEQRLETGAVTIVEIDGRLVSYFNTKKCKVVDNG